MLRIRIALLGALVALAPALGPAGEGAKDWHFNATIIEACSCPMFCQCYFSTEPASHGGHAGHGGEGGHFCKFNMAFQVNTGHYGDTNLDGVKFWLAGDLGDNFGDGEMEWAHLTFDKSLSRAQRDALLAIVPKLYPATWKSFETGEGTVTKWEFTKDGAHATLDDGKSAEIKLTRFQGMSDEPIVMSNLRYWAVPRNDGFLMYPNEVEAWRTGANAFEFKNSNGFMITIDMGSKDEMIAKETPTKDAPKKDAHADHGSHAHH